VDKLNTNQNILSWVIGGIFAVTAIIQVWRIFRKKDAVHQLGHPEEVTHKIEEQVGKMEERLEKISHKEK
jgi:dolichyl-phosphate-mannose--protein O-mannosyl transferase